MAIIGFAMTGSKELASTGLKPHVIAVFIGQKSIYP
jgi:hypothetical protein